MLWNAWCHVLGRSALSFREEPVKELGEWHSLCKLGLADAHNWPYAKGVQDLADQISFVWLAWNWHAAATPRSDFECTVCSTAFPLFRKQNERKNVFCCVYGVCPVGWGSPRRGPSKQDPLARISPRNVVLGCVSSFE